MHARESTFARVGSLSAKNVDWEAFKGTVNSDDFNQLGKLEKIFEPETPHQVSAPRVTRCP